MGGLLRKRKSDVGVACGTLMICCASVQQRGCPAVPNRGRAVHSRPVGAFLHDLAAAAVLVIVFKQHSWHSSIVGPDDRHHAKVHALHMHALLGYRVTSTYTNSRRKPKSRNLFRLVRPEWARD